MEGAEPFIKIFETLSPNGQNLLNIASHYSTKTGEWGKAFLTDASKYQGMTPEQFDTSSTELIERGLLKRGRLEELHPGELQFVENPDGDRFALPREVKIAYLKKIGLKLDDLHLAGSKLDLNNPNNPDF